MFAAFIVTAAVLLGGANAGFEQGQANPHAKDFFHSVADKKPAEGPFGVDLVK